MLTRRRRRSRPLRRLLARCSAAGTACLLVLSLIGVALAAPAPPEQPVTLTADHIEYDTQSGAVVADGHVRISRADLLLTADHVEGNLQTGDIAASGAVTLTQAGRVATGRSLRYNLRTRSGRVEQVATKYDVWTVHSEALETAGGRDIALNTSLTPCDPRRPAFLIRAQRVVVVPDDYLTAYRAALYVYGVHVFTIPQYTASLRPGRRTASGPGIGYNNADGGYVEYNYYSRLGAAENRLRVRLGSRSGLSGEDVLSERMADHVLSLHLGRAETFDQNGTLFTLDQYSLDLTYDRHPLLDWPVSYSLEAHAGSYTESQTGVGTTRGEAWLNVSSATFRLSPTVTWAASGQARVDVYGTGQERTVLGSTIGVTDVLGRFGVLTMTYNFAGIEGATPFAFDAVSPDSTVALAYSFSAGVLQTGGVSVSYSFLSRQTTLGLNAGVAVGRQVFLSASASYNLTTSQWTEVDYAVSAQCDCVSVGLLYRTFPTNPSQNQILLTVGLSAFPQTLTTVRF